MEMVLPASYAVIEEEEMMYLDGGGFVGLHINLSAKTRGMAAVVAGGFAAGVVGWYVKDLALTGPWGAGAAAAITATTAGVVGYAVKNKLKRISVGVNIPFVSWSKTVTI
ncbi:hypothetical protein GCM10022410_22260 [Amphibacillus indicireducens]|uniref:Uncharacterized protein n=2 Tax=Amphibacillus indicireducens TaxID=1076330 RepID=A0ABP7VZ97_9BACI